MEDVIIYSTGIVACSVCASNDLSPEQVEEEVNRISPTGISSNWRISEEETFKDGIPNPCPCEQNPETRKHYLLHC